MADEVLHRVDGGVSWITLNRPDVKNAISPDQRNRVIELLEKAGVDHSCRAVVLSGSGGSFCSGADLRRSAAGGSGPGVAGSQRGAPEGRGDPPDQGVAQVIREGAQRLIASILDCPKPVVASVDGVAAGIGAHMAIACDLVIASYRARFIEVFIRRALVPDGGGAYLLVRLLGPHKAKELMFFGGDVHAQDAREMGLVNCVVPADDLEEVTREWAERLATGPTRTISLTKKLANRAHDLDRDTAFEEEALAQEENMKTADAQEGVRSFVERREPRFTGS